MCRSRTNGETAQGWPQAEARLHKSPCNRQLTASSSSSCSSGALRLQNAVLLQSMFPHVPHGRISAALLAPPAGTESHKEGPSRLGSASHPEEREEGAAVYLRPTSASLSPLEEIFGSCAGNQAEGGLLVCPDATPEGGQQGPHSSAQEEAPWEEASGQKGQSHQAGPPMPAHDEEFDRLATLMAMPGFDLGELEAECQEAKQWGTAEPALWDTGTEQHCLSLEEEQGAENEEGFTACAPSRFLGEARASLIQSQASANRQPQLGGSSSAVEDPECLELQQCQCLHAMQQQELEALLARGRQGREGAGEQGEGGSGSGSLQALQDMAQTMLDRSWNRSRTVSDTAPRCTTPRITSLVSKHGGSSTGAGFNLPGVEAFSLPLCPSPSSVNASWESLVDQMQESALVQASRRGQQQGRGIRTVSLQEEGRNAMRFESDQGLSSLPRQHSEAGAALANEEPQSAPALGPSPASSLSHAQSLPWDLKAMETPTSGCSLPLGVPWDGPECSELGSFSQCSTEEEKRKRRREANREASRRLRARRLTLSAEKEWEVARLRREHQELLIRLHRASRRIQELETENVQMEQLLETAPQN